MLQGMKILIVDDDEGICKLIEKKLEAEGFSVESVYSGADAIEKCLETDNVLLLLDYQLPDMTGKQVIGNLSSKDHSVPFVIITGHGDEKIAVEMMKLGARDYITKDTVFLDILPPVVQKVAEQLDMERKLAESEERLKFTQFALERFSDAAYWMGPDARFIYVNDAACRNLGYTREELLNMTVHEIDPEFPPEVWPDHWEDLKERRSFRIHTTHQKKSGDIFPVEISVNYVEFEGKEYNCAFAHDVSERVKVEEERRQLEEQIQHAQKLESLGVLAGGIAHDFNNLLVGILGNAGLAAMKMDPESPAIDAIHKIEAAAQRAAELTNQMLAYSGRGKFVVELVNLNKLIEEMGHLLQAAVAKSAVIRYSLADGLPAVEVDSSQIRQIVMNLITNASDAVADTSGVVNITTGTMECGSNYLSETFLDENLTEGTYVFMEVSDTGHGMDKETQAKIFDPFFTTKPTGLGLGMAAVLGIVRGHNGAIKLYSEPGKGTTFKVLFPISDKPYVERTMLPTDLEGWQASGTILVVDDEETVLNITESVLSDLGFKVLTAPDGREGLKVFKEHSNEIDLVILDMTMPHMGGIETFREMRRVKRNVKVILSSGYSEEEATSQLNGKGLMGFIQKPYLPIALLEKVKEALEE